MTPLTILSDLLIWLDPGTGYCTTSIGKISSFTNRGSLGGTITQATAGARSVRTASDARFNGSPSFAGGGSAGTFYDLPSLSALTQGEAFLVAVMSADPALSGNKAAWGKFGTFNDFSFIAYVDGNVYEAFGSASSRPGNGNPVPSLASPFLYNPWSAPNDFGIRINGAAFYERASNTVGFRSDPTLLRDTSLYFMEGAVAHFFLCGSKQTAGARAAMEQWVKSNCGIAGIP